ncbi:MAG: hypothetical protein ABII79_14195 [bacterium]
MNGPDRHITPPAHQVLPRLLWPVVLVLLLAVNSIAGVLVSPTIVFTSDKKPTGRLTVVNQGNEDQEVTIDFSFGLPASDSLGNVFVRFQDSAVTDPRSALGWVKAFPRAVIVQPDESQTIRIMAHPPQGLPDGEYWARVMISSKKAAPPPVKMLDEEGTIGTQLHMVSRQAIMFKHRQGDLVCNLELNSATARLHDSLVEVMIDMTNLGNVSYMGMLECTLLDRDHRQVSRNLLKMAVYRDLLRRIDLPIRESKYHPPFKVQIRISNEGRNDVQPQDMIPGNTIELVAAVE